jgi:hypothetical protein
VPPPPSVFHEAPLEVLRRSPRAILDLLRLAGHELASRDPATLQLELVDSDLTDPRPLTRQADLVILVKGAGVPRDVARIISG